MLIITKDPDLLIETKTEKDKLLLITRGLSMQEGRISLKYAKSIIKLLKKR